MRRGIFLLILLLGSPGCLRPLRVLTDSRITVDEPIKARVTAELQPTNNIGPVLEVSADGSCDTVRGPKIAVIDVDGLLLNMNMTGPYSAGENPVDLFREKLDATGADPDICAIVVRINSPGGAVAATDMMWRELQAWRARWRRPVIACLMDLATGGAYYVATASDQIVAHPLGITGGIGVILNLYNLEDMIGSFNVVAQPIKSGANIDLGSQAKPLTAEAKGLLQAMADEFHQRFIEVVQQQRPNLDTAADATFDGRVFTARQALQRGLVDRIGYLEDAFALARQSANQPAARTVLLRRCNDPARTPYAITPNVPLQATLFPVSIPGVERNRLPTFLYLWQSDPALERLSGR
jgi:protease-4